MVLRGCPQVHDLSPSAFVMRLERDGLEFRPGQNVSLGLTGSSHLREYMIYSTPEQGDLEVLIKEVEAGLVSRQPHRCQPGDKPSVDGPHGFFVIEEQDLGRHFLFVACVSREPGGDFHARVADYLRQHPVDPATLCYLCGSSDMIYEAIDILRGYGVPTAHLFAEVCF